MPQELPEQTQHAIRAILTTEDYADEFDYPIVSFMTETLRNFLLLHSGLIVRDTYNMCGFSFGTNEKIHLSPKEIIELIRKAKAIPSEDYSTIMKYMQEPIEAAIDIVSSIGDGIVYNASQSGETDIVDEFNRVFDESQDALKKLESG